MLQQDAIKYVEDFVQQCEILHTISETAIKNRCNLSGNNFYGKKFHSALIEVTKAETSFRSVVSSCDFDTETCTTTYQAVSTVKSLEAFAKERLKAFQGLKLFCQSILLPKIESMSVNPTPTTEQVLPLAVVKNTRNYFEISILQANGCYEHQWFDACSVMIRRFTETLIIAVYEANNKASDIKNSSGDYFTLQQLIDKILADRSFNLGRDTKKVLPLLKEMGDRSAHNRYYMATRVDVDKVIPGLRVMADELLHLANLK